MATISERPNLIGIRETFARFAVCLSSRNHLKSLAGLGICLKERELKVFYGFGGILPVINLNYIFESKEGFTFCHPSAQRQVWSVTVSKASLGKREVGVSLWLLVIVFMMNLNWVDWVIANFVGCYLSAKGLLYQTSLLCSLKECDGGDSLFLSAFFGMGLNCIDWSVWRFTGHILPNSWLESGHSRYLYHLECVSGRSFFLAFTG